MTHIISLVSPVNKVKKKWKLLLSLPSRLKETAEECSKGRYQDNKRTVYWDFDSEKQGSCLGRVRSFIFSSVADFARVPWQFTHVIYDTLVGLLHLTWEFVIVCDWWQLSLEYSKEGDSSVLHVLGDTKPTIENLLVKKMKYLRSTVNRSFCEYSLWISVLTVRVPRCFRELQNTLPGLEAETGMRVTRMVVWCQGRT